MINIFKEINRKFWLLQSVQMIERLVYSALVLQMAVYISQKDLSGGLHFEHTDKGLIFFSWALVQNLTPVIFGGYADKFGRKKIMIIAVIIASIGYILAGFQRDFYPFLFSVIIIGLGLGIFRPAFYGLMASIINVRNSSVSWGLNVMLINFAVFFSPPLAKYLESFSWNIFFIGLSGILILSIIPLAFIKDSDGIQISESNKFVLKDTFRELFSPKVFKIVIILSGFMMIYMQFYETLPNFIYDWVDTSSIVAYFSMPDFMTIENSFGKMIDFKWLYNINSGFIVIAVVIVSLMISRFRITTGLIIGLFIATIGLSISGMTMNGNFLMTGMLVYTLGEMITNPKFSEYMSFISPENKKSMYMGFINFSLAIGLGGGSVLGGYLYKNYSEKSGLAIKYLQEKYFITEQVTHSESFKLLMEKTGLNANQTTEILWNNYHPQYIWLVFTAIGLLSMYFLYDYSRKNKI